VVGGLGAWGGLRLAGASDAAVPGVRLRLRPPATDPAVERAAGGRGPNRPQPEGTPRRPSPHTGPPLEWAEKRGPPVPPPGPH
ncbi:hypothetical protein GAY28_22730, partial [Azospirillum brasilense]|nr:hypothetical protein [Azospirillum brasilense]